MTGHVARLRAALASLEACRAGVDAWSGPPPVAGKAWTPGEILAHCAEMLPYWLGEIERVLASSDDPAPFGRVQTDPVRVLVVQRDHSLPPWELYSRLASEVERACARLKSLTEAEAAKRCEHATLGVMTVDGLVSEFLSGHLEQHAAQLRTTLGVA